LDIIKAMVLRLISCR